ncbi:hypothetical protein AAG906_019055 [Vitis piasezkii]
MAEEVKLFRTWLSCYALWIVWAPKIKGIDPSLLHYNPVNKQVPVLVHNGKPIVESLVILEYIDETWKQAMARFWAKFGDDKVLTSIRSVLTKKGKEQEEAMVPAMENLRFLEEELKGKKFFGGAKIGIVGLKIVDEERFPLLSAWMQDFADASIIKDNWPPRDKMIVKFQALLDAAAIAASAAASSK